MYSILTYLYQARAYCSAVASMTCQAPRTNIYLHKYKFAFKFHSQVNHCTPDSEKSVLISCLIIRLYIE